MTRFRLPQYGMALLVLTLIAAGFTVAQRSWPRAGRGEIVLRIAHDNLHVSMQRAWLDAAEAYRRLHPRVRVEVIEVPNSRGFYVNTWTRTQLVGGTAPDIMKVPRELSDSDLALFFRPLTDAMEEPNPYNAGSPLATVRWRDTFLDGLNNPECMPPTLAEVYRVPFFASTIRVFYNRELVRAALGHDEPPRTLREFLAWCEGLAAHARTSGRGYTPLAGGETSRVLLFNPLFAAQTQRFAARAAGRGTYDASPAEAAAAYWRGEWHLQSPEIRNAIALIHTLGAYMQPSFLAARREEMSLLFVQQRAAMIVSGSWDASYFFNIAPFAVGVFTFPVPAPGDAFHSAGVLGPLSESQLNENGFGITKASAHPDVAIDFLRFLTSREANAAFCRTGERAPAIVGAPVAETLQAFAPAEEQWPWGYSMDFLPLGGRWVERVMNVNFHALWKVDGSVDGFIAGLRPAYESALREDSRFYLRHFTADARRIDAAVVAWQHRDDPGDTAGRKKAARLLETENLREGEALQLEYALQHERLRAP